VGLAVAAVVSALLGALPIGDYGKGLFLNLGTELAGALVTYLLLEIIIGRRERLEAKKEDLIHKMGSIMRDVAVPAAEELLRQGWLRDGSLQWADLREADLEEAYLAGARLQMTTVYEANLQRADLNEAYLQGAILTMTKLEGARLVGANLEGAALKWANLQGARFDDNATLPDGKVDIGHRHGPLHRPPAP
jgi:hypothetical protein